MKTKKFLTASLFFISLTCYSQNNINLDSSNEKINDELNLEISDPLEPLNRLTFSFNKKIDHYVTKPVALTYKKITPSFMQVGIDNFLTYIKTPYFIINYAIQGNGHEFSNQMGRFILNTFSIGLIDIAKEAGLDRNSTSLGDTLGVYGVSSGPFIMLPFLGPSSLRDISSPMAETITTTNIIQKENQLTETIVDGINTRTSLIGADDIFENASLDEYSFLKNGWAQKRNSKISDLKEKN